MNIRHAHSGPHTAVHGGFTPRSPLGPHDKLEKEAQKWVSQTFFGAMLKQMHEGAFHSKLMDGGRGGQAFSALYDQRLAERMAHAAGGKLVHSIVNKIERARQAKAAYAKTAPAKTAPAKTARGAGAPKPVSAAAAAAAAAARRLANSEGRNHVTAARGT